MAARPNVPQFGNWDNEDNVPYTVYFEKARKGRGGKMINPNDPEENPDMFPNIAPSPPSASPHHPSRIRAQAEEPMGRGSVKSQHDRRVSREDGNFRQFGDSPARSDNMRRRAGGESPHQPYGHGSNTGRTARQSAGSDHSIERSPIHPHQANLTGRTGTSPALDGKNSYDSSHGTPGRTRMKPVSRVDESPDRGAAVPRFGDWDEKNPQAADNYTHIFNKVREERHNVPSNVQGNNSNSHPSYQTRPKQNTNGGSKQGCCFPWLGK